MGWAVHAPHADVQIVTGPLDKAMPTCAPAARIAAVKKEEVDLLVACLAAHGLDRGFKVDRAKSPGVQVDPAHVLGLSLPCKCTSLADNELRFIIEDDSAAGAAFHSPVRESVFAVAHCRPLAVKAADRGFLNN